MNERRIDDAFDEVRDLKTPQRNVREVVERGRLLRKRRYATIASAAALSALVVLGGATLLRYPLGNGASDVTNSPATESAAYNLDAFEIDFSGPSEEGAGVATVSFRSTWGNSSYPGPADCVITLRDSSEKLVGSRSFGLDSAIEVADNSLDVRVDRAPTTAEGVCGPSRGDPNGSTYVLAGEPAFSPHRRLPAEEDHGDLVSGWTDVKVPVTASGGDPGIQLCHFLITKKDGTSEELGDFTLSFGADTRDLTFEVPVAFEDLEDFDLSCGPLDE